MKCPDGALLTGFVERAFSGAKNISDLSCFPLEYHPDPATARKNLLEIGQKAMSLYGRRLMEYKGHALKEAPPPRGITKFNVRGSLRPFISDIATSSMHIVSLHDFSQG